MMISYTKSERSEPAWKIWNKRKTGGFGIWCFSQMKRCIPKWCLCSRVSTLMISSSSARWQMKVTWELISLQNRYLRRIFQLVYSWGKWIPANILILSIFVSRFSKRDYLRNKIKIWTKNLNSFKKKWNLTLKKIMFKR